jgi:phosphoadenosine phosphosulfate reductase
MTMVAASNPKPVERSIPSTTPPGAIDLVSLNTIFETKDPQQIVDWSATQFANELVMTSSFGAESALLIHMATRALPNIRIVFIDTGFLFPETHQFMEQLRARFNLNVWTYRSRNDPIAYLKEAGEDNPDWRKDDKRCCAVNKDEPTDRAMRELAPKAWLRGIRANQTAERKATRPIEWFSRYNCYAISPILRWSGKEIFAYMKMHDLPYHPLYEKGYPSIGCNPPFCTRPIMPGEDPRAGRWAGQGKFECGINIDNSLDSANL